MTFSDISSIEELKTFISSDVADRTFGKPSPVNATAPNSGVSSPGGRKIPPGRVKAVRRSRHAVLQGEVVEVAERFGWKCQYWWKSYHSPAGFPDLFMVRGQSVITAELKIPPDVLSPAQEEWRKILLATQSIRYFVWTPQDWNEIMEVLR